MLQERALRHAREQIVATFILRSTRRDMLPERFLSGLIGSVATRQVLLTVNRSGVRDRLEFSFLHRCDGVAPFARWKRANAQTEMQSAARLYRVRTRPYAYQYVLLRPTNICIVKGTNVHQHTPAFVVTIAFQSALDSLPCRRAARITN